jgi:hypothetical protein
MSLSKDSRKTCNQGAETAPQRVLHAMKSLLSVCLYALRRASGRRLFEVRRVHRTRKSLVSWSANRPGVMTLWHHDQILETYEVELGFEPLGAQVSEEGDGRTPEGDYIVDRRNPNSEFYLSIGIDYPNAADIAAAEEAGVDPGGRHLHPRNATALRAVWMTGPRVASP